MVNDIYIYIYGAKSIYTDVVQIAINILERFSKPTSITRTCVSHTYSCLALAMCIYVYLQNKGFKNKDTCFEHPKDFSYPPKCLFLCISICFKSSAFRKSHTARELNKKL